MPMKVWKYKVFRKAKIKVLEEEQLKKKLKEAKSAKEKARPVTALRRRECGFPDRGRWRWIEVQGFGFPVCVFLLRARSLARHGGRSVFDQFTRLQFHGAPQEDFHPGRFLGPRFHGAG